MVLIIFLAVAVWSVYFSLVYRGLMIPDAYDYAQIAMQIEAGKGNSTLQVFPHQVPFYAQNGLFDDNIPNLHRFWLHPLLLAFLMSMFGAANYQVIAAAVSGFFFIATVALIYILGSLLFDYRIGFLSSLGYLLCNSILTYSINGMTESGFAFLYTALFIFLYLYLRDRKPIHAALSGIFLGLGYLQRSNILLSIPAIAFLFILGSRRLRARGLTILFALFLAVASPLLAHNIHYSGKPFFNFSLVRNLAIYFSPDRAWVDLGCRLQALSIPALYAQYPSRYISKWLNEMARLLDADFIFKEYMVFFPLAIWGYFGLGDKRRRLFYKALLLVLISQILAYNFILQTPRYYFHLVPLMIPLAFFGVKRALEGITARNNSYSIAFHAISAGLLVVISIPLFREITSEHGYYYLEADRRNMLVLKGLIPPNDMVLSDISWIVATDARRRCMRPIIPAHDIWRCNKDYIPIEWIYLSPYIKNTYFGLPYPGYIELVNGYRFQQNYQPIRYFDNGAALFMLRETNRLK